MMLYNGFHKIEQIEVNGVFREKLVMKSAVAALVVDKHDKIALVKQLRPTIGIETWEIPAGVLDKELSPIETMLEELTEECNINLDAISSIVQETNYYMTPGSSDAKISIYAVKYNEVGTDEEIDDPDVTEVKWFSRDTLYDMLETGIICDPKTIIAISYVLHKREL